MKKYIALFMAVVMCMVSAFAFADAATTEATQAPIAALGDEADVDTITVEEITTFNPGAFEFTDYGFGLYVPIDWTQVEITDEMAAAGTYYVGYNAATPEEATAQLAISMVETAEPSTIADLAAQLVATEAIDEVDDIYVNDIYFLGYTVINAETGLHTAVFTCEIADNTFLSITVQYASIDVVNEMGLFPFEIAGSIYALDDTADAAVEG